MCCLCEDDQVVWLFVSMSRILDLRSKEQWRVIEYSAVGNLDSVCEENCDNLSLLFWVRVVLF